MPLSDAGLRRAIASLRYGLDLEALGEPLSSVAIELESDRGTEEFVASVLERPHSPVARWARRGLTQLITDFDANGILGIHDMFLGDGATWAHLLGAKTSGTLLDVGAGEGGITERLSPLFDRVIATELSRPMLRRLRRRGFETAALDLATAPLPAWEPFRAVTLLNVLDRCARPRSLLARGRELLAEEGLLVVAFPLPYRPHVHVGATTVDPDEWMPIEGEGFEAQARSFVLDVARPLGLEARFLTRMPYLCRGFRPRPLVALDDLVVGFTRRPA